jgi:hypothetical protein
MFDRTVVEWRRQRPQPEQLLCTAPAATSNQYTCINHHHHRHSHEIARTSAEKIQFGGGFPNDHGAVAIAVRLFQNGVGKSQQVDDNERGKSKKKIP